MKKETTHSLIKTFKMRWLVTGYQRERESDKNRHTEKETDRDREEERQRERDRERDRDRERERDRERRTVVTGTERETGQHTVIERERETDRKTERKIKGRKRDFSCRASLHRATGFFGTCSSLLPLLVCESVFLHAVVQHCSLL